MVHALLMVVLGGAEHLGPVLEFPSQPTSVEVDATPVGVATTPGGVVVAWTDRRRAEALSSAPSDLLISDLWLRTLGGGPAELICQQKSPATAPSLAWFGRLGLAWRHSAQLDRISLTIRNADGGWAGQECGLTLTGDAGASGPVVIARPSLGNALVLWEAAVDRLVGVEANGAALTFGGRGTRASGIEVGGALYVGAFFDGGIESRKDGLLEFSVEGEAFAYAQEPNRQPVLFVLSSSGNLVEQGTGRSAGPFRGQLFATNVGSPVALAETGAGAVALWWPGAAPRSLGLLGTAAGVTEAARGDGGVALVRASSGELFALPFANLTSSTGPVRVSESHGLQRRPSIAWSNGRWAVAAEHRTNAWWGVVGTVELEPLTVTVTPLPPVVWPRLLQHPSGSLFMLYGAGGNQAVVSYLPPELPNLNTVLPVDTELESGAAGRTTILAWKAPVVGTHEEQLLRPGQMPITTRQAGSVRCAAWAAGQFAVTRRVGGEARLVTFADGELPEDAGSPLAATDACVAGRPLLEPTEFGLATAEPAAIVVSTLGSATRHLVSTGAVPRDVHLAPLPNGWIVIWEDEDGLGSAIVEDDAAPRLHRLDSSGSRLRGRAAVATNPAGEAVVVWPAVVGDGVVLRARHFTPLVADGGTTGPDGGDVDGGSTDGGGTVAYQFQPTCSCSSPAAPLLFVVLVVLARRRRR